MGTADTVEADLGKMKHHMGSGLFSLQPQPFEIGLWSSSTQLSSALLHLPPLAHPFCLTLLSQRNVVMYWAHRPATLCRRKAHRQGVLPPPCQACATGPSPGSHNRGSVPWPLLGQPTGSEGRAAAPPCPVPVCSLCVQGKHMLIV